MFDITSAHHQTTILTFEVLSAITIDKACVEWNCVINGEKSLKEEMIRQAILDKRENSVNAATKDDDVDEHNYSPDDLPPYTPTVEAHSSKLHDSSKTFSCSLTTLTRKRKNRDRYRINFVQWIHFVSFSIFLFTT